MAPPRRIIREQLEILINFLESNKDITKGGLARSPALCQSTKLKWAVLAKKLNKVESGALKSPDGWKRYWIEWRHKCRKKAANDRLYYLQNGCKKKGATLNDLEIRALELSGAGSVTAAGLSTEQMENFHDENSDIEQKPSPNVQERKFSDIDMSSKEQLKNGLHTDDDNNQSHPPKWALRLEERRIAAEERTASALESMASIMRSQEERREMLEERIADAITAIAGTMQDLNGGIQNVLQHMQQLHSPKSTDMQEDVFL